MNQQAGGSGPRGDDKDFIQEWMPKIGGAAVAFFTLIFLASHPRPGSIDSLIYGLSRGVPAALLASLAIFGVVVVLRRRKKK